ncbi:MAG: UDP-N-acetylmuramate--L-alanine ligase [Breznakibacter sp.]|nr:UDP-N-acetylmuramate--L-alanine ligase [Breznakibacter sp.]
MNNIESIKSLFFVGIGGIGMSAIARYFHFIGKNVAGYDRTPTILTDELIKEGISIHFEDNVNLITPEYLNPKETLVIYTPAIPKDHTELCYFQNSGFEVLKRSQILGFLTRERAGICVAGTHGKTTVSTMISHLLKQSHVDCNAFLGGISRNYGTNLLLSQTSEYVVIEADEFDRSFLQLSPQFSVITAVDADHLDIYGDRGSVLEAFHDFAHKLKPGGTLLVKDRLALKVDLDETCKIYTYSLDYPESDFSAENIELIDGKYRFTLKSPFGKIENLVVGIPGLINVENAVAASSMALLAGAKGDEIRKALASFVGIRRRFDYRINNSGFAMIDDYAHHPEEIRATLKSVRALYPTKRVVAVFQPHLFTRTRDFASEFSESLELADEVVLLDIYPARELPIQGVTSQIILKDIKKVPAQIVSKESLSDTLLALKPDVLLMLGAGDIDKEVPKVEAKFLNYSSKN